jgi:uncharacterized membrane-anchored protein YhcB (DUF1043 family)
MRAKLGAQYDSAAERLKNIADDEDRLRRHYTQIRKLLTEFTNQKDSYKELAMNSTLIA